MSIFHKLKVGLERFFTGDCLPTATEAKRYGNEAEFRLSDFLKKRIPDCMLKRNVVVSLPDGNAHAEIDCLVLLDDKLFAIEIKHWKGAVVERDDGFHKYKYKNDADGVWESVNKSPFQQVKRAVSILKKQTHNRDWIQTVVYIEGASSVQISDDGVWFDDAGKLADYIISYKDSFCANRRLNGNIRCFYSAVSYDFIYSGTYRQQHCIIDNDSLRFAIADNACLARRDIRKIDVEHHFSYDKLYIRLVNGNTETVMMENEKIYVTENNFYRAYSLCKTDGIVLGSIL